MLLSVWTLLPKPGIIFVINNIINHYLRIITIFLHYFIFASRNNSSLPIIHVDIKYGPGVSHPISNSVKKLVPLLGWWSGHCLYRWRSAYSFDPPTLPVLGYPGGIVGLVGSGRQTDSGKGQPQTRVEKNHCCLYNEALPTKSSTHGTAVSAKQRYQQKIYK